MFRISAFMWVSIGLACFVAGGGRDALALDASRDPHTGYRITNYRSPVTLPVEGGTRIGIDELDRLMKMGAALIDVMPARAGYDSATGAWRLIEKRFNIPGSVWLPNTGQGQLDPRLSAYFSTGLAKLTNGRPDRPIVVYCMADCWMSWNAVKRAAGLGYRKVYWYADGTDGWVESGRGLVEALPLPVPATAPSDLQPGK